METLIENLKTEIIEQLNMEDLEPADIDTDEPLFGTGLGLDSIEALELIVMLEKKYGIKVKDQETGKKAMQSIRTLAQFITENQQ